MASGLGICHLLTRFAISERMLVQRSRDLGPVAKI
jgi:hypothetical protein